MLQKANRLKKKNDFEAVFKKGRSFKNSFLVLKTAPNKLKETRFGLVVSQKISKKAVVRNKVRRRLSEAIRMEINGIKKGRDMVLIALPGIENKSLLEIKEILASVIKKV